MIKLPLTSISFMLLIPFGGYAQSTVQMRDNNGKVSIQKTYKKIVKNYYANSSFITGLIAPIPDQKSNKYIIDIAGKLNFAHYDSLSKTKIIYSLDNFVCGSSQVGFDTPIELSLKIAKNTILISATVHDIKTGQIICKIVDNKWVLRKDKMFNYSSTKKHLEIIDNYGYVCFRIEVGEDNIITIRGSFVGTDCAFFLQDHKIIVTTTDQANYKSEVIKFASSLKPKYCSPLPR